MEESVIGVVGKGVRGEERENLLTLKLNLTRILREASFSEESAKIVEKNNKTEGEGEKFDNDRSQEGKMMSFYTIQRDGGGLTKEKKKKKQCQTHDTDERKKKAIRSGLFNVIVKSETQEMMWRACKEGQFWSWVNDILPSLQVVCPSQEGQTANTNISWKYQRF